MTLGVQNIVFCQDLRDGFVKNAARVLLDQMSCRHETGSLQSLVDVCRSSKSEVPKEIIKSSFDRLFDV